jgi:TolA-binding protein
MTDKDLIVKLKSLKNINPDSNWLTNNRDLLLSQISNSGAEVLSPWKNFMINLSSFAKAASKPAYALGAFILIITGSVFSHDVFGSAKPNDSLYIARVISEKAKLNTMFNSDERNKLAVQFATEHAQDISAVLADTQFNNDNNKAEVAKLNASFDKEIDTVKTRISYLNQNQKPVTPVKDDKVAVATNTNANTKASDTVSMAGDAKDNKGVEVVETPAQKAIVAPVEKATSTDAIINEAKQLFDKKDYTKAADKLKEVDELIKN